MSEYVIIANFVDSIYNMEFVTLIQIVEINDELSMKYLLKES